MASCFSSSWPDPHSPVLSKIDFGVPLVDLFKWLDVRDTFLDQNGRKHDITKALALARDCKHPDAVWLTSIFEGKNVSTEEDAREVLLLHQDDARALCLTWCLKDEGDRQSDLTLLRRSFEMGNAFACSRLCVEVAVENEKEAFRLAQIAAALRERDGFYLIGRCLYGGIGCEEDLKVSTKNLLIAAELGHVHAANYYGCLFDQCDPARWVWLGRAAMHGRPFRFLDSFSKQVEQYFSGSGNASILFLIGHALKGKIDALNKRIFGKSLHNFILIIGPANQAVSFYDSQIKSAGLAVDTWTLISTRLNVIKDLRIFIGKMIWEARFEANYKI